MNINEIRILDSRKIIDLIAFRHNTRGSHSPDFCSIIAVLDWFLLHKYMALLAELETGYWLCREGRVKTLEGEGDEV